MRRRKRIARALDWLIEGWIASPMIDQEALDALIDAVAELEPKGGGDRATNARPDSAARPRATNEVNSRRPPACLPARLRNSDHGERQ
jgi:hypothetical protein